MKIARLLVLVLLAVCILPHAAFAYYNPSTGRWLSRDPIHETAFVATRAAIAGGSIPFVRRDSVRETNLYAFVENRPTTRVDPDGLWSYTQGMGRFKGTLGPDTTGTTTPWRTFGSLFTLDFIPEQDKFRADGSCGSCKEVRFIQIYMSNLLIGYDLPFGWHLDADSPPYYDTTPGIPLNGIPAAMQDVPHFAGSRLAGNLGLPYDFIAETCAVCSKGGARGDVYGCIKWLHSFDLMDASGVYRQIGDLGYSGYVSLPGAKLDFDSYRNTGVTQPSMEMRQVILEDPRYQHFFLPE